MTDYDLARIYSGVRERVTALVRGVGTERLEQMAPATPEWRGRDILAHLVGTTADVIESRLDGVASDSWTKAQVEARSSTSIEDLLAEWEHFSPQVEPLINDFPTRMQVMFLVDAVTHEHDLRGAINTPGARDSIAIAFGFDQVSFGIGRQRAESGALRIIHEAGDSFVGTGEATATLRTTRFEILRAAVGRRSASQIAMWDWDGLSLTETVVIEMFAPPRATDLKE